MILIDLPMPKACDVCPFNYDFCWCTAFRNHDEWEKYSDDWNYHVYDRETRPEYCPLKEIVRCKDCKYAAMDMCCDHPIEWDNGESRNHCNPDWYCPDGEHK